MVVDCYVEQSTRNMRKMLRGVGYVLECNINGVPQTANGFSAVEETAHAAELIAIRDALERMRKPADIQIHTEDAYVLQYIDMIDMLAADGFRKKNGEPLGNRELWADIYEKSKKHNLTVRVGKHQYCEWIRTELRHRKLGS